MSIWKPPFVVPPKLMVWEPGGSGSIISQYPSVAAGKTKVVGQSFPGTTAPKYWSMLSWGGADTCNQTAHMQRDTRTGAAPALRRRWRGVHWLQQFQRRIS